MIHKLWYASLVLEFCGLIALDWRKWPYFALWLAFDVITGAVNVWLDHEHRKMYASAFAIKQPIAILLRAFAAQEVWKKLHGPVWARTCVGISAFIVLARTHSWPHTLMEAEFAGIAACTAALGIILWLSLQAAMKLTTDPVILNHGYVMCGYFLLFSVCYFAAWGYRETMGRATGIVACIAYGTWFVLAVKQRKRHRA